MNWYWLFTFLILALTTATATAQVGTQIASGQTVTIDVHGECRQVTNPGSGTRMVFTSTSLEWKSFRDNPNGLTMTACSGSGGGQCLYTGNIVSFECFRHDFYGDYTYACTDAAGHSCDTTVYAYNAPMPAGYPYRRRVMTDGFCGEDPGSITIYQNDCSTPPAGCTAPWGGTVAHGSNITAYQAPSAPHGSSCASQTRTCNNGTLSGSYANQNCTVQPLPAAGRWASYDSGCAGSNEPGVKVISPPPGTVGLGAGHAAVFSGTSCSPVGQKGSSLIFPSPCGTYAGAPPMIFLYDCQ